MVTLDRGSIDPGAFTAGLEELERDARQLQRVLSELRTTAESGDGLIQATVGGRGELIALELDPRIYREADSEALAADIMATIKAAATRAQEQLLTHVKKLLPANIDPGTVDVEFDPLLAEIGRLNGRPNP